MIDIPATDSQTRVAAEVLKALLEIVRRKAQVCIELHDEIPIFGLKGAVSVVEGFHHASARFPKSPVGAVHHMNPRMLGRILVDDLTRPVGRAIIHDDPLRRQNGLAADRFERGLDESLFIPHGRDDYIGWMAHENTTVKRM